MPIADVMPRWAAVLAMAVSGIVLVALGWVVLKGIRGFGALAERTVARRYEGLAISRDPAPGLVSVVFHTYCGLLVFVIQQEHRFWATPDDARTLLSRLHRFNLTWGFLAYGALVIPLLSFGNYWAQKRRIEQQAVEQVG